MLTSIGDKAKTSTIIVIIHPFYFRDMLGAFLILEPLVVIPLRKLPPCVFADYNSPISSKYTPSPLPQ